MKAESITVGILAHVDAGKTTLSESVLYLAGSIRKAGRVDHGSAFLDTEELERARGITIFSKQAQLALGGRNITLLDTPGHVDFAAEMERTLSVLDYGILVINGADGVQSHTDTLWKLLEHYGIPVFLFVNKMDQPGTDRERLLSELQKHLDEKCVDFGDMAGDEASAGKAGLPAMGGSPAEQSAETMDGRTAAGGSQGVGGSESAEAFWDSLAMCSEELMEEYLECGEIGGETIARAVRRRQVFPCYFGSALKMVGVQELLKGLEQYSLYPDYPEEFGARVYKISRDTQGNRLTHMKITGGRLKVKDLLSGGAEEEPEKADQIRIYSGAQFRAVNEAGPGTVCAVTGLFRTRAGTGLGTDALKNKPVLAPILTYQIILPSGCDVHGMLQKLRELEEEQPQLHIVWDGQKSEIHAQVMGEIEMEILRSLVRERYGVEIEFGAGSVVYKETIAEPVEGVGHFEPLRHYAEVHLILEPGEPGSGLVFESRCSEDLLDKNWQRLVLTHLAEKAHRGVLVGAEITDMKIALAAGKGHVKHTEGGDFRQATYRAVRQGLRKAKCVLLEPVSEFRLEVPEELVGRALADIQRMNGSFQPPETEGDLAVVKGSAPAAAMQEYQMQVITYTRGRGRLFCTPKGYEPCHNAEEVIAEIGYDPEGDLENPTGSVFCSHGVGFNVPWDQVERYMHVDSGWRPEGGRRGQAERTDGDGRRGGVSSGAISLAEEKELEEIFQRTYGPIKKERNRFRTPKPAAEAAKKRSASPGGFYRKPASLQSGEQYLLVDGYNIIYAWDDLKELAAVSLDGARERLIEILCNYQGYKGMTLIVVFDAYKVSGGRGSVLKYGNIHVIYTKEAETADQYIEAAVHRIGRLHDVTVATSDGLVQMIIWGEGARRLSARDLREEIDAAEAEIRTSYGLYNVRNRADRHYPFRKLGERVKNSPEEGASEAGKGPESGK
ncbi:translation factor GTPase family protein [Bacilliculturomica massiliensis]|uniref:translation factor GTPase family protein n=1 Tax=Bacilliculturomica massiliensis TaxID=1917867 RepID=UPI0010303F66|nr:TetM/TetW/TetO/TetS family tetracycline resistance ribosomal protection protein [Bacilliculturomica massiliensis]